MAWDPGTGRGGLIASHRPFGITGPDMNEAFLFSRVSVGGAGPPGGRGGLQSRLRRRDPDPSGWFALGRYSRLCSGV